MLRGPEGEPGQGRSARARSGGPRRAGDLPSGIVPQPVLLLRGERGAVRAGRNRAWAHYGKPGEIGAGAARGGDRIGIRTARAGPVPQHRRGVGDVGRDPGPVSQDAHPGRPALLREVLLHARRPGLSFVRDRVRPHRRRWSAGTSGIRRRRGSPACKARRFCSTRPRSAGIPSEKAAVRRGAARRVAYDPALARHRQRRLRGCGESHRLRRAARARHRVLGLFVRRGSFRAGDRGGFPGQRRNPGGRVRSGAASRKCGATGRSCATGGSMLTARWWSAGSRERRNTPGAGLPHAGGMGAARGHLARLAAQPRGLAWEVCADSLGLRGDCGAAGARRACAHPDSLR